jgi:hypothetical protein
MRRGLWQAGMVISLTVHGFVYGVMRPVVVPVSLPERVLEAEFLGAILTQEDLEVVGRSTGVQESVFSKGMNVAQDRGAFLERLTPPALKPIAQILKAERSGLDRIVMGPDRESGEIPVQISCDLNGASAYLKGFEIRDFFKWIERQEIHGEVVFDVTYAASGRIERVSKILGSGNPLLDDSLAVRVQESVVLGTKGRPGRVRLRLRLR